MEECYNSNNLGISDLGTGFIYHEDINRFFGENEFLIMDWVKDMADLEGVDSSEILYRYLDLSIEEMFSNGETELQDARNELCSDFVRFLSRDIMEIQLSEKWNMCDEDEYEVDETIRHT